MQKNQRRCGPDNGEHWLKRKRATLDGGTEHTLLYRPYFGAITRAVTMRMLAHGGKRFRLRALS